MKETRTEEVEVTLCDECKCEISYGNKCHNCGLELCDHCSRNKLKEFEINLCRTYCHGFICQPCFEKDINFKMLLQVWNNITNDRKTDFWKPTKRHNRSPKRVSKGGRSL